VFSNVIDSAVYHLVDERYISRFTDKHDFFWGWTFLYFDDLAIMVYWQYRGDMSMQQRYLESLAPENPLKSDRKRRSHDYNCNFIVCPGVQGTMRGSHC
jgi:hypothetical protein